MGYLLGKFVLERDAVDRNIRIMIGSRARQKSEMYRYINDSRLEVVLFDCRAALARAGGAACVPHYVLSDYGGRAPTT